MRILRILRISIILTYFVRAGEPCCCHRCAVPPGEYLSTKTWTAKSTARSKRTVEESARGLHLRSSERPLATWAENGSEFESGPGASRYNSTRKRIGIHIFLNAFWLINSFCIHQMLMRDPMHQIDHGVIIQLLKGILRKYSEEVEVLLGIPNAAVHKLTARLKKVLEQYKGPDNQRSDLSKFRYVFGLKTRIPIKIAYCAYYN